MSSDYDGSDARQRLRDIRDRLALIDSFVVGFTRDSFVADVKTRLAVIRLIEEICEAAYWFVKHENGRELRSLYPDVDFGTFGGAGNIYRHQYGSVDYRTVWDDLHESPDIEGLRKIIEREVKQ